MGYNKTIESGKQLETYEYEYDLPVKDDNKPRVLYPKKVLSPEEKEKEYLERKKISAFCARRNFKRLVLANLDTPELPLLLTPTYNWQNEDIKKGYNHLRAFFRALRYRYGDNIKYIAVPEFQPQSNRLHFHALVWGLSHSLRFTKEKDIEPYWGQGYVKMKMTDGHDKLSSYLTKYMTKAGEDPRLKNQKSFVYSRNCNKPVVNSGVHHVWPIVEYLSTGQAVQKEKFRSSWLGECKYNRYIKPDERSAL